MQNLTIQDTKRVQPDFAILPLFSQRFSPYAFSGQAVSSEDLRAIFEAARYAPSSYNEQPWRYIVATSEDKAEHERLVRCLAEPNRPWAKRAPVLAIGLYKENFSQNDKPNKAAPHDLGIASAFLTLEATQRNLFVHQMIGIEPDSVRQEFKVPEGITPFTALAIGYLGDSNDLSALPEDYAKRDKSGRERLAQDKFIFSKSFGEALSL